jgi:hypothetical protein
MVSTQNFTCTRMLHSLNKALVSHVGGDARPCYRIFEDRLNLRAFHGLLQGARFALVHDRNLDFDSSVSSA